MGKPREDEYRELAVLHLLLSHGRVGRPLISKLLGLGEGIVRRVIRELRMTGLIQVKRGGCALTDRGFGRYSGMLRRLKVEFLGPISIIELLRGGTAMAVQLKGPYVKLDVMGIRDAAVRAWARGALIILVGEGDRLSLPLVADDIKDVYPDLDERIRSSFKLKEGDMLLVSFADKYSDVLWGALNMISFVNFERDFWEDGA